MSYGAYLLANTISTPHMCTLIILARAHNYTHQTIVRTGLTSEPLLKFKLFDPLYEKRVLKLKWQSPRRQPEFSQDNRNRPLPKRRGDRLPQRGEGPTVAAPAPSALDSPRCLRRASYLQAPRQLNTVDDINPA